MTTTPATPGVAGLLQIAMPVQDIERAIAFYRDVIGLPFLFQAGNLAFFNLHGVRLLLDIPETEEFRHPGSILYFRVPDLNAGYEAMRAHGVEFISEPHLIHNDGTNELWMAFFRDGEGNVHALASEVPVAS
ncbi:MAG: VOC family protein [Chloroflexi bacterium]|nr:VOC family protein [Chloroflexota bacterium]MDA1239707.1 VOC family protein [Chloroflexota bacterium]MQC47833.1 VOC family protein [Chloroflexota bacterium]